MSETAVLKEVNLTLALAPEMELEACEKACAVAEHLKMSPEHIDEVRMAVVEAVINAIEHSGAPDGRLYMNIAVLGDERQRVLQISVRDHGVGFAPGDVVKPRIEDKLKATSKRGWGLKIIEGLMDEVDVRSGAGGTEVVMRKVVRDDR
jgi:serine/threonine-protein kinase RsbW